MNFGRILSWVCAIIAAIAVSAPHADSVRRTLPTASPQQTQRALQYGERFQSHPMMPPPFFSTPPMAIPDAYTKPSESGGSTAPGFYNPYWQYCMYYPYAIECRQPAPYSNCYPPGSFCGPHGHHKRKHKHKE